MKVILRITLTDEGLIKKIRAIPTPDRGRVIQRALKVYFDTVGGREVYEMLSKEGPGSASEEKKKQPSSHGAPAGVRDILGDY